MKTLRPDLNLDDPSSEIVIRGKALAGIVSGLYGDQLRVHNDTFAQDARSEAVNRKASDLDLAAQPATNATCASVPFTGLAGSTIPAGATLRYIPTGILYSVLNPVTLDGSGLGTGIVNCLTAGQIGNISAGNTLRFDSPPTGVDAVVTLSTDMASGADPESLDSFRTRLLSRLQHTPAGGNQFDYPAFAFLADPSVRSALIRRFGRGLGTVDVYITAGTADIDSALDQGLAVIRIPGSGTIATVQAYYDANAPLTDCPRVVAPTEQAIDVTVKVDLAPGLTLTSVPSDAVNNPLGLTVSQLIQREISRVLYKYPTGGRKLPGSTNGFVVAADIETQLDAGLSAVTDTTGTPLGKLPILVDRQVQNLDGANVDKQIAQNILAKPGTYTVTLGV